MNMVLSERSVKNFPLWISNAAISTGKKICISRSEKFQDLLSLLTSLAFVPTEEVHHLWDTVIESALDSMSSDLTPEIEDYVDYFTRTYIGKIGLNGLRAAPRIATKFWVQYDSVLNQVPSTNNAAEAWNHAWNLSCPPTSSLWRVIDGFKRKDQLAFNKWRQDIEFHEDEQENEENEMGTTANRRKGKEILMRLSVSSINACLQYHSIQDKKMYLMMIRSIA